MGARAGCPPPHLAMEQCYHYGTPVPTITPSPMRAWSSLEDERLAWLVETRQPEQLFREALPGRSDAECRDRWARVVHPLRDYKAKDVAALLSKQVEVVAGLTCEINRLRTRLDEYAGAGAGGRRSDERGGRRAALVLVVAAAAALAGPLRAGRPAEDAARPDARPARRLALHVPRRFGRPDRPLMTKSRHPLPPVPAHSDAAL